MCRRPGSVGLRSKYPGITGAMGPSTLWDPCPTRSHERPWGQRVYTDRRERPLGAVLGHLCTLLRLRWLQSALFREVRRSGQAWGRKSVHRSAKTAPRSRSGAFVYTVAPSWAGVGAKECTQIGENGPTEPFWGICVHCCDASRVGWNEGLDRHGASAPAPPLAWRLR